MKSINKEWPCRVFMSPSLSFTIIKVAFISKNRSCVILNPTEQTSLYNQPLHSSSLLLPPPLPHFHPSSQSPFIGMASKSFKQMHDFGTVLVLFPNIMKQFFFF